MFRIWYLQYEFFREVLPLSQVTCLDGLVAALRSMRAG